MATVTSLPELVTGVSALALADAPDIALGNVLGACIITLTMIVFLDLLQHGG
jgi:cation:H+ antiporter